MKRRNILSLSYFRSIIFKYCLSVALLCLLLTNGIWAQPVMKLIITEPNFINFTSSKKIFMGSEDVSGFTVRNTGTTAFTGIVNYKDTWGSSLQLQDVVVSYEGGALPVGTSVSWIATAVPAPSPGLVLDGLQTSTGTLLSGIIYQLSIINLPVSSGGINKGLVFTRRVKVVNCIDDNVKGLSTIELQTCDNSNNCNLMDDSWQTDQSGTILSRLTQRINKADNEFVDVFNVNITNNDFCAYNPVNPIAGSGVRKVSLFTKMHNPTSGEIVRDYAFRIWSEGNEEIPLSQVQIFKAAFVSGSWQKTGAQLAISPETTDPSTNFESYSRALYSIPTNCFNDAIHKAYYKLGDLQPNDAYYVEFNVYNCNPALTSFSGIPYDRWFVSWLGKDDCGSPLYNGHVDYSTTSPASPNSYVGDPNLSNTNNLFSDNLCGSCYFDNVASVPLYIERVTTLMKNDIGNCRIKNQFVSNQYSFTGTSYSDGINYDVDNGKLVIMLKLERGLDYYTTNSPSQYYQNLHFRRQDGKNWIPTNTAGAVPGYNIPTIELPQFDYNEIRMFEFDMADLYALFPGIPLLTFDQKRQLLYDYLNSADITYSLLGNCDEPDHEERPNYSVEMYLISDTDCLNPLVMPSFKITKDANIMCPGCQFAGGAGRSAKVTRVNYGLKDSNNNNGIPDDGSVLAEADINGPGGLNVDLNPDNNIRTNFGIVGDRVRMNTKYYLTSSESCNGIVFDDMMIGPLKYSFLRMGFPGDTFAIDNSVNVKVTISTMSGNYTFSVPMASILVQNSVNTHLFEVNVDPASANYIDQYNTGTNALPPNFRFRSSDEIELEFFMDVALNSSTSDVYQEVFFQQSPFFSSTPLAQYVRDFPQFGCVNGSPVVMDKFGNVIEAIPTPPFTDPIYNNTWLLCEGYSTVFNLLKVTQEYYYLDGTTYGEDLEDKSCLKRRMLSVQSSIGKVDAPKIFSNEFRPAPMIESIDAITPFGYQYKGLDVSLSDPAKETPLNYRGFSYSGPGTTLSPSSTATIGGETYTVQHIGLPPLTIVTDLDVASGNNKDANRQIDERLAHIVAVINEAICNQIPAGKLSTTPQPAGTTPLDLDYKFKIFFDQDNVTDKDVFISNFVGNEYTTPVNQLTSTLSSTGVTVATAQGFNLNFNLNNGGSGSPAKYPFVTIEYDKTVFSGVSISSVLSGLVTDIVTISNGNIETIIYKVDPDLTATRDYIGLNSSVSMDIKGKLIQCFNDPNIPALLKIGFGWDCNGWPSGSSNLNGLCYYNTEYVEVFSIAASLQDALSASSQNGDCSIPKIHYDHLLTNTGSEVNEVSYSLDLPVGLSMDMSSILLMYGNNLLAAGTDYTINNLSTIPNPEQYQIVLSSTVFTSIAPFASAVVQGNRVETINLQFDAFVSLVCNEYQPTAQSIVKVTSKAFCGTVLHNDKTIVPNYTACTPFNVTLASPTSVCFGNSANLTASLSNTVAGSYTYTWVLNGVEQLPKDVQITNVNVSINKSFILPLSPSPSVVTINVKNSTINCIVSETKTIIVNSRPIVSINPLPAEYCIGTPPISLIGNPSGGIFSGTGVTMVSGVYQFSYTVANVNPGYTITYTYTDPATACPNVATAVIKVSPCCKYTLGDVQVLCGENQRVCIPITAVRTVNDGIIGMDFSLKYNNQLMRPTGNATIGGVVLNGSLTSNMASYALTYDKAVTGQPNQRYLHGSIFYTGAAPATADFAGTGEVICIEFEFIGSFTTGKVGNVYHLFGGDMVGNIFAQGLIDEEYKLTTVRACMDDNGDGVITIVKNNNLNGKIIFHDQDNFNSWLKYDVLNPNTYLITQIRPSTVTTTPFSCLPSASSVTNTDLNGTFSIDMTGSNGLKISRDIAGDFYTSPTCTNPGPIINGTTYSILAAINGYDSYLMESITTFRNPANVQYVSDRKVPGATNTANANTRFPTPFQMIAADVNMSNTVRANDITLVQQRAVAHICEYPQNWNYTQGTDPNKFPANAADNKSLDWRFTDKTSGGDFNKSVVYPNAPAAVGQYWRDDVPEVPACLSAPVAIGNACKSYPNVKNIYAILLGDLDGSWRGNTAAQQNLKVADNRAVILDYKNIQQTGTSTYRVPVKFNSNDTTVSVDFALDYDEAKLKVIGVGKLAASEEADARMMYNDHNGQELMFTSYSMTGFGIKNILYYIDFTSVYGDMTPQYLGHGEGYLNGQRVDLILEGATATGTMDQLGMNGYGFEIVPNPINGSGNIIYNLRAEDNARIVVYNAIGQIVLEYNSVSGNGTFELAASELAEGMYQVVLYKGENDRLAKKMVIQK
jgi:hypothetical protein